jgi:hypothetical protein
MHWTALLAKRYFPPGARVIADVPCVGCGYNVRGALASGLCPECARPVGDSLFVLSKPQVVARGLRSVAVGAWFYLAVLAACLLGAFVWLPLVIAMVLCCGSIWRVVGVADIRFRGEIHMIPLVGTRLKLLWTASVIELIATSLLLLSVLAVLYLPARLAPAMNQMFTSASVLWFATTLGSLAATGWFGHALADMLATAWTRFECAVQMGFAALWGLLSVGAFIFDLVLHVRPLAVFCFGVAMLLLCAVIFMTYIVAQHLSNFAEQETDTWEDAVDAKPYRSL